MSTKSIIMSRKRVKLEREARLLEGVETLNYNPMMNDVILKHLFEVVGHQELNTFRQVCKQWYNLSLASWLKNGPPISLNDEDWNDFRDVIDPSRGRRSRKLSEIVGIQRYPKFWLKGRKFEIHAFDLFREMYGPWLTYLTVHYYQVPGVVRLLNLLTCKFTPNLEFLEVVCVSSSFNDKEDDDDERRELPMDVVETENKNLEVFRVDYTETAKFPMDWKTLLNHYPKLEHFSIGYVLSTTISSQMEPILNAIKEIRKDDEDKLNLKSLDWFYYKDFQRDNIICDPVSPSVPRLYRESKLAIESFKIHFSDGDSDEVVNNILSTFASSLKDLDFYRFSLLQQLPFRNMDQLGRLTLVGYPVANLLFLTELPNLRWLSLKRDFRKEAPYAASIISATTTGMPEHLTFPSMTQFWCDYKVSWTEADVNRLADLMPNLTRLAMFLENPTFRLVCQHWPRLELLWVYGDGIGDVGLVGLDKDGPEIVYNQPNITNLTELKTFAMDCYHLGGDVVAYLSREDFSEHSVLGGFCRLRQLKRLILNNVKMDAEVAELLIKKSSYLAHPNVKSDLTSQRV